MIESKVSQIFVLTLHDWGWGEFPQHPQSKTNFAKKKNFFVHRVGLRTVKRWFGVSKKSEMIRNFLLIKLKG